MDKAIEKIKWLQDVFVTRKEQQHFDVDVTIKDAFAEALSELQAHKAKMEEQKEWYKNRRDFFMSQIEYVRGQEAEKIHQKLEELDK